MSVWIKMFSIFVDLVSNEQINILVFGFVIVGIDKFVVYLYSVNFLESYCIVVLGQFL